MLLTTCWSVPEQWVGACELTLTVSQHQRDWSASYRLHRAAAEQVGVEFYTDGSPWTLTVELTPVEASPGDIVRFDQARMHMAVVDVNEAPVAYDFRQLTRPSSKVPVILFNGNQGGLMNRLVSLLSVIETATRLGCAAKGWWAPNPHCAAHFADLFDLEASGISLASAQQTVPAFQFYYNYHVGEPPLSLAGTSVTHIVHSTAPLRTDVAATTSWQAIGDTFRRLQLSTPIKRKLAQFSDVDFTRTIGFHIRRPYPNGAFVEQEREKFKLGETIFVNLLEQLRAESPEFERVLLCPNDPAMVARMNELFPGYVFAFAKESIDNTAEALAVQEAIVDVMLLSRCPILFSQSNSSFAVVASAIGRSRLFCLTPQTDEDSYDMMRFDVGQHVDNFTIPRANFRQITSQMAEWCGTSRHLHSA